MNRLFYQRHDIAFGLSVGKAAPCMQRFQNTYVALGRHGRRLTSIRAAELDKLPYSPTLPPRPPNVTDGSWDAADQAAVDQALRDAAKLAKQKEKLQIGGGVILTTPLDELKRLAEEDGQPAYRATQLRDGVLRGAHTLGEITDIPKAWRASLEARGIQTGRSVLHHKVQSTDGTRKFLLKLADGFVVETVGIPESESGRAMGRNVQTHKQRLTVCVSSQVGCPMRCHFCSTGKGGFARNLLPHEIVDQVMTVQEEFGGQRVSNVVFMGMGEPLLNLPSVMAAHLFLNRDLGIGARHITISTVGVPNAIAALARYRTQSTLAISIHAPTQALRERLVPSAKAYPLEALMKDCVEYFRVTGRRVSFEYTLLAGVNDSVQHAAQLADLLRRHDSGMLRSHVNVIPWNPIQEDSEFSRPSRNAVLRFVSELQYRGMAASVRQTRGLDAAAACGQLRNEYQKQPLV